MTIFFDIGYQEGYKCEMNRILDELMKNSAICIEKMTKRGEWKRMKEWLNDIAVKSDNKEVKKFKLIFNDEFEMLEIDEKK